MKINILKSIIFVLFAMHGPLAMAQQSESLVEELPDSLRSWNYHYIADTENTTNVRGNKNNDTGSKFLITRPAVLVVNNAGSELDNTAIFVSALQMYPRPFNYRGGAEDSSTAMTTSQLWTQLPFDMRKAISKDVDNITPDQAFFCTKTVYGSHIVTSEGGILPDNSSNNGKIKTNIYVHYFGDSMADAIDAGTWDYSRTTLNWAATEVSAERQDSVSVYYKLTLSSPLEMTFFDRRDAATKLLLLDRQGNALDFSDNYPPLNDSLSQIKGRLLPEGTYYLVSNRYRGQGLAITVIESKMPSIKAGDDAENPIDLGSITKATHIIKKYNTEEYNDCYSNYLAPDRKDIFLKINFPQPVEFTLSPDDTKTGGSIVTLRNSDDELIDRITTNAYPNTSMYRPSLEAGSYYIILEGAASDGEIGVDIRLLPLDNITDSQWSPSADRNYIATIIPTYETPTAGYVSPSLSQTTIQYFDDFGRPLQTKQYAASPDGNDIAQHQEYNVYGMPSRSFLPVDEGTTGRYTPADRIMSRGVEYYSDSKPYNLAVYDSTSLMRNIKQFGPGNAWHESGRSMTTDYDLNQDSVTRFAVGGLRSNPKLVRKSGYAVKSLSVKKITDEDGHSIQIFTDINGRKILSRMENGSQMLDTYSVYDDYGNLCFVLPPMIEVGNTTADILDKYAYMYRYDYRNRCVAKKLPGAEWTYYVYDYADNLIFTQDGESRSRGEWSCTIYDKLKRPVISGVYKAKVNYKSINGQVLSATFDKTQAFGYVFNIINPDSLNVLSVNYYDDYEFRDVIDVARFAYVNDADYGLWHNNNAYNAKGLLTGTIIYVLDEDEAVYSVKYYDERKRPIQVWSSIGGDGYSLEKYKYDLMGNVINSMEIVKLSADVSADTVIRQSRYDKMGRLLSVRSTLNDGTPAVVNYEYDEVGRLVATTQGEGADTIRTEKKFNVRGWMTEQNSRLFSMKLKFNDPKYATPSYTGNVTEWSWRHGPEDTEQTYVFTYDDLSRLIDSRQYENGAEVNQNVERDMDYDKNGNILALTRYSQGRNAAAYTYTYNGNQLNMISYPVIGERPFPEAGLSKLSNPEITFDPYDPVKPLDPVIPLDPVEPLDPVFPLNPGPGRPVDPPVKPDKPFEPAWPEDPKPEEEIPTDKYLPLIPADAIYTGLLFRYDYNGNMVYDALRKQNIRYNRLNLTKKVFNADGDLANYRYLANRDKLSVTDASGNGLVYHGSLVYQKQNNDLLLESAAVKGGRIVASLTSWGYNYSPQYFFTDHLGSTRVVTDGTVSNTTNYNYYPYGKLWANSTIQVSDNRYLFNGKEWQPTGNVALLDYGDRMYDSELGIWKNLDGLSEKNSIISPYTYCLDNPLKYVDMDGRDAKISINEKDHTITITANIILEPERGIGTNVAKYFEKSILDTWDKGWKYTTEDGTSYDVKFDVAVRIKALDEKIEFNGENNYIKVINSTSFLSRTSINTGVWSKGTALKNSAAHEFGHILGLDDKYDYNSDERNPLPGWEENIMSGSFNEKGKKRVVEQRNINTVLLEAIQMGAKVYYIDIDNNEIKRTKKK